MSDQNGSNGSNGHGSGGGVLVPFRRPAPQVRVAVAREPPPTPDRPPSDLKSRLRASPVTFTLAAINIVWFLWIETHGSSHDPLTLIRYGAVQPMLVHAGQFWRVATYMFVHIGYGHIILNTWAGVSWCVSAERALGGWRFLLVYLVAGIGGGVSCVLFSDAITAGASGSMFGIIGAILAIRARQLGSFKAFTEDRGVRATFANIAIWTVLGIVAIPMSHAGHGGGFVAGGLLTWVLVLPQARRAAASVGFAVVFAGVTAYATQPWNRHLITGASADFSNVKLGRLGVPRDNARAIELAAPAACAGGNKKACVIAAIARLDPDDPASYTRARPILEEACTGGDADACAALGNLLVISESDRDLARGSRLIQQACDAGSEYGCELHIGDALVEVLQTGNEPTADAGAD